MSYQWTQACDTDAIALQREIPETLPGTDRVIYRTPFKDVLAVAQRYPLEAELVLTTKADPAAVPAVATAGQPAPPPSQAQAAPAPKPIQPGATSSPASSPAPAKSTAAPQPPLAPVPVPKPPALPTSVGTKPPSPNTKMPEHVPYRIDPSAGLKPMEETERFIGAALMLFGTFARVIMANGAALSGVGGVVVVAILDMMKSPTNLAILVSVIALGVTAVGWFIGFILDKLGLKIKKRGEATSTQAMY